MTGGPEADYGPRGVNGRPALPLAALFPAHFRCLTTADETRTRRAFPSERQVADDRAKLPTMRDNQASCSPFQTWRARRGPISAREGVERGAGSRGACEAVVS